MHHHQRHLSDCTALKKQPLSCFDPIVQQSNEEKHQITCPQSTQQLLERNNSFKSKNEYLKAPLEPQKDHPCPKHSPMLPTKEYSSETATGTSTTGGKGALLSQIIPPPIEYSPRTKCKHDLIQFDTFKLPSPPLDEPTTAHKKHLKKHGEMETSLDEDEPKLVRKPSRKQLQQKSEDDKEVRNISLLKIGDLPVPPPPQYSPRSSTRKKEYEHYGMQPPPQLSSPKAKHIHWKPQQQPTDNIATHSIVRPIKSVETPQTFDGKIPLQPKGSLSPTRLEKFLSQAVSVQSTLAPIRIPKSSLIGLVHPVEPKVQNNSSPVRSRRYSVHSSGILETLGVKGQPDPANVTLSPMRYKQSTDMKILSSSKEDLKISRDASTDSQDLIYPEKRILSRDASTDSEDLIQFDEPKPTEKVPEIKRTPRDPLLKSFSVDEASRLPPFLTPSLFIDCEPHQYNIAAMVSPSKQLQTNLRPGNGNSYQFLAPRRSWQDIGVHKPSQPNLDILLASEEAALSPIWLPKQPLEPLRSPKVKKQTKEATVKTLSRKDSLSPSNSFTRSKRAEHSEDSIVIVTKKDVISPSNSFNRSKKAEELLSKDCLSHFNSFVKSRKSSQDIMSPAVSRRPSQEISSPKSPRKKLSPSPSIDKLRRPSQELIVINSEPQKKNSPKSPRKKRLSSSNSQELIIISSPNSPTKKTSSPKSPKKKLTPSQSFDKRVPSQELIYINSEAPPPKKMSPSRSSQDLGSSSSSSPKAVRKKKLSPSRSFDLSRRPSRELIIISSPVLTPSPRPPRKKTSKEDLTKKCLSPAGSRRSSKTSTPIISRKNSLSPSNSFNVARSSPIPIPSPKRSSGLSRSNSFSAKSKMFSQTLSIEIPSPYVLSRSGSINESLSPNSNQRQTLLSPALEAALISEITSKLAGVHSNLSPNYGKQSIGINVISSPRGSCIHSSIISPQKSLDIPDVPELSSCVSSSSSLLQFNNPGGSSVTSQLSLEVPDISSTTNLSSSRRSSSSCIYANVLSTSPHRLSVDDATNNESIQNDVVVVENNTQQASCSTNTNSNNNNVFGNNMSPEKSPKIMTPIQCPITVEIHVRIPKTTNDDIAMKSQGTQIP